MNSPSRALGPQVPGTPDGAGEALIKSLETGALAANLRAVSQHMKDVLSGQNRALGHAARPELEIAVLIPCHNEASGITGVITDMRAALPSARIYVFDNCSTDTTAAVAAAAGAEVRQEARRGKGNVVRRMFADIDADIYLMIDGDGTYDAGAAPQLIALIAEGEADMAIGGRRNIAPDAHRRGHAVGNRLFNFCYGALFGAEFTDIFSGYRAFSRRFVKSFPALSSGFEIETELSVHASQLKLPVCEVELPYGKRANGSNSKLRTVSDGLRILKTFAVLLKETRPALFFGALALALLAAALGLAAPLVSTWLETGLVPRLPTAVLCVGLSIVACLLGVCGLILDSLARSRVEQKRILYLAVGQVRR